MPQPDDPTYDVSAVQTLIDRAVPELAPARVRHLGRGWDHDVFVVNDAWAFRFARHPLASAAVEVEQPLLTWLAPQLSAAVPVIQYVGEIPGSALRFAGHRLLSGVSVCDAGPESTPEGRASLAPALGKFLRSLHALDPSLAATELRPEPLGRLNVARRGPSARAVLTELRESKRLTTEVVTRLFSALDRAEAIALGARSCIVHADLHARNLLVHEGELSGVIDWVDVCLGHPAIDLAAVFVLLPKPARLHCLAEYGAVGADTLAWAHWRAITYTTAAFTGALARDDAAFAAAARVALEEMSHT